MIFTLKDMIVRMFVSNNSSSTLKEDSFSAAQYVPLSASNQQDFVKSNQENKDNGNESGRNS